MGRRPRGGRRGPGPRSSGIAAATADAPTNLLALRPLREINGEPSVRKASDKSTQATQTFEDGATADDAAREIDDLSCKQAERLLSDKQALSVEHAELARENSSLLEQLDALNGLLRQYENKEKRLHEENSNLKERTRALSRDLTASRSRSGSEAQTARPSALGESPFIVWLKRRKDDYDAIRRNLYDSVADFSTGDEEAEPDLTTPAIAAAVVAASLAGIAVGAALAWGGGRRRRQGRARPHP